METNKPTNYKLFSKAFYCLEAERQPLYLLFSDGFPEGVEACVDYVNDVRSQAGREQLSYSVLSTYHFFTRSTAVRTAVPSITAARIPIIVNVAELMVMFKNNILVKHLAGI